MLPFSVLTSPWNLKIWKSVRIFPVTNIPSQNPKVVMAYSPTHKLLIPFMEALIIKKVLILLIQNLPSYIWNPSLVL